MAGFPFTGFNWPIWYNTDLLKKAGVDRGPGDLRRADRRAAKLRAAGIQPLALGGAEWPVQNFITWMGQQYVQAGRGAEDLQSRAATARNPDVVKGLDLLAKLRDAGVFIDNVAGLHRRPDDHGLLHRQGGHDAVGLVGLHQRPGRDRRGDRARPASRSRSGGDYTKPTAYNGHSTGFFLSPNGEKKIDAVKKFIQYMYTPDGAARAGSARLADPRRDRRPSPVTPPRQRRWWSRATQVTADNGRLPAAAGLLHPGGHRLGPAGRQRVPRHRRARPAPSSARRSTSTTRSDRHGSAARRTPRRARPSTRRSRPWTVCSTRRSADRPGAGSRSRRHRDRGLIVARRCPRWSGT